MESKVVAIICGGRRVFVNECGAVDIHSLARAVWPHAENCHFRSHVYRSLAREYGDSLTGIPGFRLYERLSRCCHPSTLAFGAVGFWDDYLKLTRQHNRGFLAKYKFSVELVLALIVVSLWCVWAQPESMATRLSVPFFKSVAPDLGLLGYIPIGMLVIVGTSNAVNLTDGLDGLAVGPVIIATFVYAGIAYVAGHVVFSDYLNILHVRGAGEVAVFCGALFGACLGFLWFNAYPAQVFMGDVGALALGGALGTIAMVVKHELLLLLIGGLFVIETLSVMIQVMSFKLTGKRVFRMAPLHHHFEAKGWKEPKVIVRFWIIAIVLALISLSTLKLR
jgi:phospho-N-acetylmuramoyl-pentapeptide-transferase